MQTSVARRGARRCCQWEDVAPQTTANAAAPNCSTRGRGGGLRLGRPAEEIHLGDIVRLTESGFDLESCSDCALESRCKLKQAIALAGEAFLAVLNQFTLADMLDAGPDSVSIKVAHLQPILLGSLSAPCRTP